jgi:hypothetical protein
VVTRSLALRPMLSLLFAYVLIGPYLVLALRRVYREALPRILLKAGVMALLTLVIDSIVNALALLATIVIV